MQKRKRKSEKNNAHGSFILFQLSSSNSMTFHYFFHDLSKFSMTLGLAATLKIFQDFPCFRVFFDLTQCNRQTLVFNKMCAICTVFKITLCLSLSLLRNLQRPTTKFYDFPGLENEILKFHDFPDFPSPVLVRSLNAKIQEK